jgi:hypothetical protein
LLFFCFSAAIVVPFISSVDVMNVMRASNN